MVLELTALFSPKNNYCYPSQLNFAETLLMRCTLLFREKGCANASPNDTLVNKRDSEVPDSTYPGPRKMGSRLENILQ